MKRKKDDVGEIVEQVLAKCNYDWDKIEELTTQRMAELNDYLTQPYTGTLKEAREILRVTDLMMEFTTKLVARTIVHKMESIGNDSTN